MKGQIQVMQKIDENKAEEIKELRGLELKMKKLKKKGIENSSKKTREFS